jgi:predicted DNA-binding protein (UPF0251 family)
MMSFRNAYYDYEYIFIIMVRPRKCRMINCEPLMTYFKPRGVPMTELENVSLAMDEFEALRLKDLEELDQEKAATTMNVSQPTFHRILESAHKKVADALVRGKAIRIEGGDYVIRERAEERLFKCYECENEWQEPYGTGRPSDCPKCHSTNIHRAPSDRGHARPCQGRGMGGRWRHGHN